MESGYVTNNPEEADLFYIPYYSALHNIAKMDVLPGPWARDQFKDGHLVMWWLITRHMPYFARSVMIASNCLVNFIV